MALGPLYIYKEGVHEEGVVDQVVDRVVDRVVDESLTESRGR